MMIMMMRMRMMLLQIRMMMMVNKAPISYLQEKAPKGLNLDQCSSRQPSAFFLLLTRGSIQSRVPVFPAFRRMYVTATLTPQSHTPRDHSVL